MKKLIFFLFFIPSSAFAVNWGNMVSSTTIPDCQDSGGNHINFTAATSSITCGTSSGGGGSPAGSNTNVQFNNSGSFGGNNGFQYDSSVSSVTINGSLIVQKSSTSIPSNLHFDPLFPTVVFTAQPIFRQYVNTKDNGVRPSLYSIGVSSYTLTGNNLPDNRIDMYPGDGAGGNLPTLFFYNQGNLNYEIDPNAIFTYPPATFYGQIIISSTVIDGSSNAGTSGQVFTSNGPTSAPTWQTLSSGIANLTSTQTWSGINTYKNSLIIQAPLISSGTLATVNACGPAGTTLNGTLNSGIITIPLAVLTSCVINFPSGWLKAPSCMANDESSTSVALSVVTTTSTLTINASASLSSSTINYLCMGVP